MKKIVLFIIVILDLIFVQTIAFAQEQDIYQIAYLVRLENKVKSNWIMPHGESGKNITIFFTINKKGEVVKAKILVPSGDEKFDQIALMSVYKSAPFEHFLQNVKSDTMNVQFYFSQEYIKATSIDDNNVETCENNVVQGQETQAPTQTATQSNNLTDINNIIPVKNSALNEKVNGIDFNPYMKRLQGQIKSNWNPPKHQSSKTTVVLFKIDKSGNFISSRIRKSSGNKEYDNAALAAIAASAPFESFPIGENSPATVDIQFKFDYNVLKENNKNNGKQIGSIKFNHYYYTVPIDMSSPITKIWILDKLLTWSWMVTILCLR